MRTIGWRMLESFSRFSVSTTCPTDYFLLHAWTFLVSLLTALLEIQIEGPHGWAKRLPTWRIGPPWLKMLLNGKEITGYHLYFILLLLAFFHFPTILLGWSWALEATILSSFFVYAVIWDFLWFVLNPAFGWASYSKEKIWWFRAWIGPFPLDYYMSISVAGVFAALKGLSTDVIGDSRLGGFSLPVQHLLCWGIGLLGEIACVFVLTAIWQLRRRWDKKHSSA